MRFRILILALFVGLPSFMFGYANKSLVELNNDIIQSAKSALNEKNYDDVIKLWLIHNGIKSQLEKAQYGELITLTWYAASRLGICPQNLPKDELGAGLWSIVVHNYIISPRKTKGIQDRYGIGKLRSFTKGKQYRKIDLNDVISPEELGTIRMKSGHCDISDLIVSGVDLDTAGRKRNQYFNSNTAVVLKDLLSYAQKNIATPNIIGKSVINARLFLIGLYLVKNNSNKLPQIESFLAKTKRKLLGFTADDWASLPYEIQFALFPSALETIEHRDKRQQLILGIIDRLIALKKGESVEGFIAFLDAQSDPLLKRKIWNETRSNGLLALDRERTGFKGRSIIAWHKAVEYYDKGDLEGAFKYFSLALEFAGENPKEELIKRRIKNWISRILSEYRFDRRVIDFLYSYLKTTELREIEKELIWKAAIYQEPYFFKKVKNRKSRYRSMNRSMVYLNLLGTKRETQLIQLIHRTKNIRLPMKFFQAYIDRLTQESFDIHRKNISFLGSVVNVLESWSKQYPRKRDEIKKILTNCDAILKNFNRDKRVGKALLRDFDSRSPISLGAINIMTRNAIPWEFEKPDVKGINIFEPIDIKVEYKASSEEKVVYKLEIEGGYQSAL